MGADRTQQQEHAPAPGPAAPPPPTTASPVVRLAGSAAVAAAAALLAAWWTPRGPVSTVEAIVSMAAALAVGALAGWVLANRWALLLAPAVFVVVFEAARLGVDGPSVDGIRLGSVYGVITFVAGRGVHGLLVLVPMVLGARLGVEVAARSGRGGAPLLRGPGRVVVGLSTALLLALAVLVAWPASTAPITTADGRPVEGSIAELTTVTVDGREQALMIRGVDADAPVLLHLAGGPGGTDIGAMRLDETLEQDFVVVTWDQPGTGKSYGAIDPVEELTLERVVQDTLAVTAYLQERFDEDKVVLTGQSWGTLPGVLAVQREPERFHAFVGTGQMVDIRETDQAFYDDTLAWARRTGDDELVATLVEMGPPPYADPLDYTVIVSAERELNPYPEWDGSTEMTATIWGPENSFMDTVNAVRGLVDTYSALYPQLQELDLRDEVPALDVPVVVVMGEFEARGRVEPAREWFDRLEAPATTWVVLPDSSHRASFERPADYADVLRSVAADLGR